MLSINIKTNKLTEIPYIKALKNGGYSDSDKTCFELENISIKTKLLILSYLELDEIIFNYLDKKTMEELNFLGYDELINKISSFDKFLLIKINVLTKEDIILNYYEKYRNKLIPCRGYQ